MTVLRRILLFLGALVVVATTCILSYDLFAFQPHRPDIDKLLARAGADERAPPESLTRVLQVAYAGSIDGHVARHLLQELLLEPTRGSKLGWHGTNLLWSLLIKAHLSKGERDTLFLSLSYMGNGQRGYQQASMSIIGVPLAAVSLSQAATLVTVGKSPASYLANPQRLAERAKHLAERAASAP
jgi:Transglycosylase